MCERQSQTVAASARLKTLSRLAAWSSWPPPKKEPWGTSVIFKDSEGNQLHLGSR